MTIMQKIHRHRVKDIEKILLSVGRNMDPSALMLLLNLRYGRKESDFLSICKSISNLCDERNIDVVTVDVVFEALRNKYGRVIINNRSKKNEVTSDKPQAAYISATLRDYISTKESDLVKEGKPEFREVKKELIEEQKNMMDIYSKEESSSKRVLDLSVSNVGGLKYKKTRLEIIRTPEQVYIDDTAEAFRNYFVDRYLRIKKILLKKGLSNIITTRSIKSAKRGDHLILIVREKYKSRGGAGIIVGEDLEGETTLVVPLEGNLALKFKHIFLDTVLAFRISRVLNQYCMIDDIIFPEIPRIRERHHANDNIKVAIIGDLHIGSKVFLKNQFENFISFLSGKHHDRDMRELATEIRFVIINGDIVDGVGVYPEQKKELEIVDIYKQYEIAADYISQLPEDKEVIILPGNHDAAGKFIPQPPIPREVAEDLYKLSNVKMLGNPSLIRIENVNVLIYHGYGLEHIAAYMGLGLDEPTKVLIELLRSRHLMPQWGKIPIAPIIPDHLCIDDIPDILVTSHLHIADIRITAGGILLVSTGAFQGLTTWQKQLGISPTVGVVPIVDLKNYRTIVLNCNGEECSIIDREKKY